MDPHYLSLPLNLTTSQSPLVFSLANDTSDLPMAAQPANVLCVNEESSLDPAPIPAPDSAPDSAAKEVVQETDGGPHALKHRSTRISVGSVESLDDDGNRTVDTDLENVSTCQ